MWANNFVGSVAYIQMYNASKEGSINGLLGDVSIAP
jgi:hypothetical protein